MRVWYSLLQVQVIANFLRQWSNTGIEPVTYDNDVESRVSFLLVVSLIIAKINILTIYRTRVEFKAY